MSALVSVIIPFYNAEKTIQKCIKSVINQSYKDIEVILVDDGSTDASVKLCEQIINNDLRFRFVKKKNGGVSSARNSGIENSKGIYLMFLDSDDWLDENIIQNYMNYIKRYGVDVVIGSLNSVSAQDRHVFVKQVPMEGIWYKNLWNTICDSSEMFGYIGGKFFRKDIIDIYHIRFNERMYAQEDLDFCLSYYKRIDKFYLTNYAGYNYFYEQGKRIPPYCDFMRNQLKLLSIAEEKSDLNLNSYSKIQQRILGYIYIVFYEAKNKETIYDNYMQMKSVDGLDLYLKHCRMQGEQKYIVGWYLKEKCDYIYCYFKLRGVIKKIFGRN